MKIAFSELCVIGGQIEENIDRLIGAGAENIELMLDGIGWNHFELQMDEIVKILKKKSVNYAVHTPVWDINLTSENADIRNAVMETYKQSILFAEKLDACHVVIHPGFCYTAVFSKELARKRSRESVLELLDFAKEHHQNILVENVGSTKTSIFNEDEFCHFLDDMPDNVGYIIDLGHALITKWDIPKMIRTMGSRLKALHIHDNDGVCDAHLPIGYGIMDWESLYEVIKESNPSLWLIMEYNIGTSSEELTRGKIILETAFAGYLQ